jgi:hypothetical protein
MPRFTLFERPAMGDEIPNPLSNPARNPGDPLLIIERVLVDRRGRQRGTMTVRGTILWNYGAGDALWALQGNYKLRRGVINTQSVFRFSQLANGVTFAIVGGTDRYRKAHGTVAARRVGSNPVELKFRVS